MFPDGGNQALGAEKGFHRDGVEDNIMRLESREIAEELLGTL